jgi:hypothetical protein
VVPVALALLRLVAHRAEGRDIVARAERAARAGEHDRAHAAVRVERDERIAEVAPGILVQRVRRCGRLRVTIAIAPLSRAFDKDFGSRGHAFVPCSSKRRRARGEKSNVELIPCASGSEVP